jgi:hypothetical protein
LNSALTVRAEDVVIWLVNEEVPLLRVTDRLADELFDDFEGGWLTGGTWTETLFTVVRLEVNEVAEARSITDAACESEETGEDGRALVADMYEASVP